MKIKTHRKFKEYIFKNSLIAISLLTVFSLLGSFVHILYLSVSSLIEYLFIDTVYSVVSFDLLINGILGSFMIILFSSIISFLFGFFIALFQYEQEELSFAHKLVSNILDSLQAIPYIVAGFFVYLLFQGKIYDFSAIAAILALSLVMLPQFSKSILISLEKIPANLKEAAYALGASPYKIVFSILLPAAFRDISREVLSIIAMVSGLAAPLFFIYEIGKRFEITELGVHNALPLLAFKVFHAGERSDPAIWVIFLIIILFIFFISLFTKALRNNE